jgi:hypothetical protein
MVKFELEITVSSLTCVKVDDACAAILGAEPGSIVAELLTDSKEVDDFKRQVQELMQDSNDKAFATFTLVFRAPGAPEASPGIDRSPINGGKRTDTIVVLQGMVREAGDD